MSNIRFSKEMRLYKEDWCIRCDSYMDEEDPFYFPQNGGYQSDKICENCKDEMSDPNYSDKEDKIIDHD